MTRILLGKKQRDDIRLSLQDRVNALGFSPLLIDVVVGNNPVSLQYVHVKKRVAESLGIRFHIVSLPEDATTDQIITALGDATAQEECCGCIVQLPLPDTVDTLAVLSAIPVEYDVDCLHPDSETSFYDNQICFQYPTARAIMVFIENLGVSKDNSIVVIGQGKLVGRPVTHLLQQSGYVVVGVHKNTENKNNIIAQADVIISAIGSPESLRGEHVKRGCIVIDAGTSEMAGSVVGDIHRESVVGVAGVLVPVPGGVGPTTTLMLCDNVIRVAEQKYEL
jgi:methylenetetrahydrofolate dehydrogenase (NADP+)/methenyltetrahydrofolate cyclohydrolase